MSVAVVIPVKAFAVAKVRLAPALSPAERAALARSMATGVVGAAGDLPVTVVCDDDEVASWATALGVEVAWTPGLGLDGAVAAGVAHVAAAGAVWAMVAHADLPLARDLAHLVPDDLGGSAVLVPDRHRDGSNVVGVPAGSGFGFAYGPGSFGRHHAEALRCGLTVEVRDDPHLGWDIDRPADLDVPADLARTR